MAVKNVLKSVAWLRSLKEVSISRLRVVLKNRKLPFHLFHQQSRALNSQLRRQMKCVVQTVYTLFHTMKDLIFQNPILVNSYVIKGSFFVIILYFYVLWLGLSVISTFFYTTCTLLLKPVRF